MIVKCGRWFCGVEETDPTQVDLADEFIGLSRYTHPKALNPKRQAQAQGDNLYRCLGAVKVGIVRLSDLPPMIILRFSSGLLITDHRPTKENVEE